MARIDGKLDWFDPRLTITLIPDPCWTAEAEAAARSWLALLEHLDATHGTQPPAP